MAVVAHRRQRPGIGAIQVDQDIPSIPIPSVRVDVHVASLAVAHPQKADGREVCQLRSSPQPFSGERLLGRIMDQTHHVQFPWHRCQSTDRLRSECEAEVKHDPDSQIESGWWLVYTDLFRAAKMESG
jgi:hypothetical protein